MRLVISGRNKVKQYKATETRELVGYNWLKNLSGLPFPSPGDLPNPGIEPWSLTLQADALQSEPPGKPVKESRYPINKW